MLGRSAVRPLFAFRSVAPRSLSRRSGSLDGYATFTSSSKSGNKSSPPPPPPRSSEGRQSVFRKFAESVKKETQDEDLKASVTQFQQKLTELDQNESIRRAREILAKAKEDVLRQNEAIVTDVREKAQAVREAVGGVTSRVGSAASTVVQPLKQVGEKIKPYVPDIAENEMVKRVGKTVSEAEERLLEQTNVYQYGGFKSRELREKSKAKMMQRDEGVPAEPSCNPAAAEGGKAVEADPEAGGSMVVHKDSRWSTAWGNFKDNNVVLQRLFGLKRAYEESNNIFVYFAREITSSISDRFASLFSENETARAIREIQARDPSFGTDKFLKFATEHIIPEILDAFLAGDLPTLRLWCSEAMFNLLKSNFETQLKPGCRLEGRVLDMRHVELVTAKLLDTKPVVVLSFNTQQVSLMRDAAGTIVEGAEDNIENVLYVMALAKEELPASGKLDELTQGWRLVELAIRDKNGSW